jgi:5'-3' exonuclease
MGIVRLAKCLKILNSLTEYTDRKNDINNKIDGNRVYMDFISIVYKVRETIINELNYLLFNFLLIKHNIIDANYDREKYVNMSIKFNIDINTNIDDIFIKNYCKTVEENIYKYIYDDIVFFVCDMINSKLKNVEHITIAFDGVPSYAKMQEQRHRRYMRYAFIEFKKYINNKEIRKGNKLIDIRQEYDKIAITCDIKQSIEYVYKMYHSNNLKTDIEKSMVKNGIVNIIDKPFGEGEKILMDLLLADFEIYKNEKSYVYYSPDGDSVLLCLKIYITTKVDRLNVVKAYTLQPTKLSNTECQYVNIPKLYENISKTIIVHLHNNNKPDYDLINNDFITIMSFFGNDFVCPIPSLDIECSFLDLLYLYSKLIDANKYITKIQDNKTTINYDNFVAFLTLLKDHEHYLLLDTYLADKQCKNKIINTFGSVFSMRYYIDYQEKLQENKTIIIKNISDFETTKKLVLSIVDNLRKIKTVTNITYGDIFMKTEIRNIDSFINNLLKNRNFNEYYYNLRPRQNKDETYLFETIQEIEKELLNSFMITQEHENQNNFEYQQIRKLCNPHKLMPTSLNDIDLFLLDWKSGKWRKIINAKSPELGYDWKKNKIKKFDEEINRYTREILFHNTQKQDLLDVSKEYLKSISWVVDYYLNTYDLDNKCSTWSYNYEREPFITQLYNYCMNYGYDCMKNVFEISLIDSSKYINDKLHKLYIYPQYDISKIPSKYHDSFPNIRKYIKKVMKYGKSKGLFDARMCPFFSKTFFKNKKLSYDELLEMGKYIS